jgi:predicted nucleotidyltransferase
MSLFLPHTQEYSVVDPIRSTLDKNIIKNDKIDSNIREKILIQADQIEKYFKKKIQKIYVIGSSLTYQHTPECDIDITLLINVDKDKLKTLNQEVKEKFNEKIFVKKHPINFHFISGRLYKFKTDAIYDLKADKWLKKPEALSEHEVEEIIKECQGVKEFNEILQEYSKLKHLLKNYEANSKSLEGIFDQAFKVNYLFEKIRDIRREEFNKRKDPNIPSANFRCSNIIYKMLEQYGLNNLANQITKFVQSRTTL